MPDALAASAGAFRIATLDHETIDHAVEEHTVVVAGFGMGFKIFHCLGGSFREEFQGDVAQIGGNDGDFLTNFWQRGLRCLHSGSILSGGVLASRSGGILTIVLGVLRSIWGTSG